jgi:hypothetical protein
VITSSMSVNPHKGVMFTFGHREREDLLYHSIVSMYENYARQFHVPIVIFYAWTDKHTDSPDGTTDNTTRHSFQANKLRSMLTGYDQMHQPSYLSRQVTLVPIVLPSYVTERESFEKINRSALFSHCGSTDAEAFGATVFLRYVYMHCFYGLACY